MFRSIDIKHILFESLPVLICVSTRVVVREFLEMPRSASTELKTIDPGVRVGHVGASLVIDELIIT